MVEEVVLVVVMVVVLVAVLVVVLVVDKVVLVHLEEDMQHSLEVGILLAVVQDKQNNPEEADVEVPVVQDIRLVDIEREVVLVVHMVVLAVQVVQDVLVDLVVQAGDNTWGGGQEHLEVPEVVDNAEVDQVDLAFVEDMGILVGDIQVEVLGVYSY